MKEIKNLLLPFFFLSGLVACESGRKEEQLPIMGHTTYEERVVDGKTTTDTIYHTIDQFVFYDQDSNRVSRSTVDGKVYVADFFFTTCPARHIAQSEPCYGRRDFREYENCCPLPVYYLRYNLRKKEKHIKQSRDGIWLRIF